MTPATKLQRAKIGLLLDEPFFGTLLCNLAPVQDKSVQTMATDGSKLIWSPDFVNKLSEPELKTVLAHEVMHCGLMHHLRRGNRDSKAWNIACDLAVNSILEQCNLDAQAAHKSAPFSWPSDPKPVLDMAQAGKSAEELYCAPVQNQPSNGDGDGGSSGMGDVLDAPDTKDESQASVQEANWKQAVVQAATAAKGRGTIPAAMAKLVEELLNPKASWQELLRRFISDRAQDDYSWTKPNPRYASSGFILPSLHSQRLGTIAIVRDTSGSTQDWQGAILAELAGIIHECQPSKIIVVDADADVQRVLELEPSDALPADALGGGGTDFAPALAKLEEFSPVCAVYLTDLDGSFPSETPSYPVLWATNARECRVPFGEVIEV